MEVSSFRLFKNTFRFNIISSRCQRDWGRLKVKQIQVINTKEKYVPVEKS